MKLRLSQRNSIKDLHIIYKKYKRTFVIYGGRTNLFWKVKVGKKYCIVSKICTYTYVQNSFYLQEMELEIQQNPSISIYTNFFRRN